MQHIHVAGAGALGSTTVDELVKILIAVKAVAVIHLYDFDTVEERNLVSQNFYQYDLGQLKCEAVAKRHAGNNLVQVVPHNMKLTEDNLSEILQATPGPVICLLDNLPSRLDCWWAGYNNKCSVLQGAIAFNDTGFVEWTTQSDSTWTLDPTRTDPGIIHTICQKEDVKLPPCELTIFRNLIINTSLCTAIAVALYLGYDIKGILPENTNTYGCAASFKCSTLEKELTTIIVEA